MIFDSDNCLPILPHTILKIEWALRLEAEHVADYIVRKLQIIRISNGDFKPLETHSAPHWFWSCANMLLRLRESRIRNWFCPSAQAGESRADGGIPWKQNFNTPTCWENQSILSTRNFGFFGFPLTILWSSYNCLPQNCSQDNSQTALMTFPR